MAVEAHLKSASPAKILRPISRRRASFSATLIKSGFLTRKRLEGIGEIAPELNLNAVAFHNDILLRH